MNHYPGILTCRTRGNASENCREDHKCMAQWHGSGIDVAHFMFFAGAGLVPAEPCNRARRHSWDHSFSNSNAGIQPPGAPMRDCPRAGPSRPGPSCPARWMSGAFRAGPCAAPWIWPPQRSRHRQEGVAHDALFLAREHHALVGQGFESLAGLILRHTGVRGNLTHRRPRQPHRPAGGKRSVPAPPRLLRE